MREKGSTSMQVSNKPNKYSSSGPKAFKSGSYRVRFSLLFLCYKKNLLIFDVNYVNTLYMVLFQSSFIILCSTHGSLKKFGCSWSAMGKETNSNLGPFTEQTIFDFLLTIFSPYSTTKFAVL